MGLAQDFIQCGDDKEAEIWAQWVCRAVMGKTKCTL